MLEPIDWILASGLVATLPMMWAEAITLWSRPHFQFFPFAWIVFALFLFKRGSLVDSRVKGRQVTSWVLISAAVLLLAFSVLVALSPWLAHLSLVLLLLGWLLARFGSTHWYVLVCWVGLIAITLPLPMNLDTRLIQGLQLNSSRSASALLDLTGTVHLVTGNVIEIKQGKLFVDQACSGVGSLYALAAVAMLLVVWQNRSLTSALVTFAAVPCWAWFGNVVRLFAITVLYDRYGIDLTKGWQHEAIGILVFALGIFCFMATLEAVGLLIKPLRTVRHNEVWSHKFYNWLTDWPRGRKTAVSAPDSTSVEVNSPRKKFGPIGVSISYVALGLLSLGPLLGIGPWRSAEYRRLQLDVGIVQATFDKASLPEEFEGIRVHNFRVENREKYDFFGEYSATWFCQDSVTGKDLVISLDFPFPYFHPLEICYESTGHEFSEGLNDYEIASESGPLYIRDGQMVNQFGELSRLYYMEFAPSGACDKFQRSFFEVKFGKGINEPLMQLQLLVKDSGSLKYEDDVRYRSLLASIQKMLLPIIQKLD